METKNHQLNEKKRAVWLSLSVGIGMFIAKISAYYLTGSSAIFSDAAESVVHVAATSMALYSIYLSSKPADLICCLSEASRGALSRTSAKVGRRRNVTLTSAAGGSGVGEK